MSSGTQVDMDWAGADAEQGGAAASPTSGRVTGAAGAAQLTDEEILGLEPMGVGATARDSAIPSARADDSRRGEARSLSSADNDGDPESRRDSSARSAPRNDKNLGSASVDANGGQAEARPTGGAMPAWMAAAAADPKIGGEAQQLWREHQEFRAAFGSPEEARAVKELLPGGVKDVLSLREATQSVERIDAALFSGDARAQADVVAELARANPAAFRSMFAEAARVLAGMGEVGARQETGRQEAGKQEIRNGSQDFRENGAGQAEQVQSQISNLRLQERRRDAGATTAAPVSHQESQTANHPSRESSANQSSRFDAAAYAAFERATNDEVARDVRGSISETLGRVMPEGVAEGASRRMGEDIFNEVHRALAADRALSEQVASVLRDRRFGAEEQQRVAALVAGRAKQLVPSVARRVIGEWTSTVLNTARSKAARQAAAASRVDIAAAGGSLDSMPLRAMSAREVNYASMSDEEILGI